MHLALTIAPLDVQHPAEVVVIGAGVVVVVVGAPVVVVCAPVVVVTVVVVPSSSQPVHKVVQTAPQVVPNVCSSRGTSKGTCVLRNTQLQI